MSDAAKIKALETELAALKAKYKAPEVSPLAPAYFPEMPAVQGVRFAAAAAGVKYKGRDDVMLAECAPGSVVAGVFTKSSTRSAPVLDCQAKLAAFAVSDKPLGILVNSGNSNAFTGRAGEGSVEAIVAATATALGSDEGNIFTASTGVIGERLPHDRILDTLDGLVANLDVAGAQAAAKAIMTTDTFPKGASAQLDMADGIVTIAGFAKGSGMIAPDMATMLVYIFTDAKISQSDLQSILSSQTETSFNAITVDSDTSTSDSLMVVATGQSDAGALAGADLEKFRVGLSEVMMDLAHQVVKDGEGATKFIEITVEGASDDASAKRVALSVANSPLVKTAVAGEDPNWGRVVAAIGKSGEPANRDKISIWFGDVEVAKNGWVSDSYSEEQGAAHMKEDHIIIRTDMGIGTGKATVWTCDLTHQYISINADYRS